MQQSTHESSASVFMMPNLYHETIQLLLQARSYFEGEGQMVEASLQGLHKHHFSMEMSRITLRLSCAMAWLSVQKAICAGEISRAEARAEYPLEGQQICLSSDIAAEHILPRGMNELLENTQMLYERVYRLEQQAIGLH